MVNSIIQLPILRDDLVIMSPLTQNDFSELWKLSSNPEVWAQHPAKERATVEGFTKFFEASLHVRSSYAIRNIQGEMVGMSSYYEYDDYHNMISIGFTFFGLPYWGKGYNPHVKQLMMDYAFDQLKVEHVIFHVDENNIRSQSALDKLGIKKINEIHTIKRDHTETHNVLFMKSKC